MGIKRRQLLTGVVGLMALAVFSIGLSSVFPSNAAGKKEYGFERFKDGEKLTYNISFGKFENAAYAELFVASKGTLEGKPAVELRGRVKSNSFVSAAFYLFDRSRTVFASEETGIPLYIRDISLTDGLPVEKISTE